MLPWKIYFQHTTQLKAKHERRYTIMADIPGHPASKKVESKDSYQEHDDAMSDFDSNVESDSDQSSDEAADPPTASNYRNKNPGKRRTAIDDVGCIALLLIIR